ncbi:hypothetical protein P7H55_00170 [Vagococcus lutrae]|uniref:hypothetical protein n=1 Tax=Vagococcus lutrae TaxID=81947 RepID=UPI00288CA612|nr:hypothetical protein [Vagococcus lutrae]MDT2816270.1 hypothetical protein [Vagococcus lutrae]
MIESKDLKCENIFNIENCTISKGDVFLVDTNIWFWLTYQNASSARGYKPEKVQKYTTFMNEVMNQGAKLHASLITYTEIMNIVERTEFDVFNNIQQQENKKKIPKKEFRRNSRLRKDTTLIIKNVIEQIDSLTESKDFVQILDYIDIKKLSIGLENSVLDPSDIVNGYLAKENNVINIISDDSDFYSLEGINLYTANPEVINAL